MELKNDDWDHQRRGFSVGNLDLKILLWRVCTQFDVDVDPVVVAAQRRLIPSARQLEITNVFRDAGKPDGAFDFGFSRWPVDHQP